jgi:hypothetical protein
MLDEILDEEIKNIGATLEKYHFRSDFNAITIGKTILLSSALDQTAEVNAIKAHELGHQHTCAVNLLEVDPVQQQKFEYLADRWATLKVMPLSKLVGAFQAGLRQCEEYCDYLEIPPKFFARGLSIYADIYGRQVQYQNYLLVFEPFCIKEL